MVDRPTLHPGLPGDRGLMGASGDLLGGRYRLTGLIHRAHTELWRAQDDVLARTVAVRVLGDATAATRREFLAAAAQAGRYPGAGVSSVLDAATEFVSGREFTFVVSEWVDGPSLQQLLLGGPLAVETATAIIGTLCDTLSAAHHAGVFARRLHPGNVLLPATGNPVLVDLEVTAVLADVDAQDGMARDGVRPGGHAELVRADTRDLARVLYACVTGCWLSTGRQPWTGLPEAPQREGRLCLPREVRAGLPRGLDLIVALTLEPSRRPSDRPIETPAELGRALKRLVVTVPAAPAIVGEDDTVSRRPRLALKVLLSVLLLAALATGGLLLGLVVGRVPAVAPTASKVPGLHASPSAGVIAAAAPLTLSAVNSFDPQGDNREDDSRVVYATDGDDATAWTTEEYKQLDFGGSGKSGVGLLVDLGSAKSVSRVVLTAPPGQTIQILAAPTAATRPTSESPTVTPAVSDPVVTAAKGDTTIAVKPGTTSRWYVVWITGLTTLAGSPAFGGTIQEMALYG